MFEIKYLSPNSKGFSVEDLTNLLIRKTPTLSFIWKDNKTYSFSVFKENKTGYWLEDSSWQKRIGDKIEEAKENIKKYILNLGFKERTKGSDVTSREVEDFSNTSFETENDENNEFYLFTGSSTLRLNKDHFNQIERDSFANILGYTQWFKELVHFLWDKNFWKFKKNIILTNWDSKYVLLKGKTKETIWEVVALLISFIDAEEKSRRDKYINSLSLEDKELREEIQKSWLELVTTSDLFQEWIKVTKQKTQLWLIICISNLQRGTIDYLVKDVEWIKIIFNVGYLDAKNTQQISIWYFEKGFQTLITISGVTVKTSKRTVPQDRQLFVRTDYYTPHRNSDWDVFWFSQYRPSRDSNFNITRVSDYDSFTYQFTESFWLEKYRASIPFDPGNHSWHTYMVWIDPITWDKFNPYWRDKNFNINTLEKEIRYYCDKR